MKRLVKRAAQTLVSSLAPHVWRWRRQPSLLILMYHRVLPQNHADRATEQPGMYVSPQTLAMHLDVLKEHFTLLHLDEWLNCVAQGRSPAHRACAVTFDDGWRDNYGFAFPVLKNASAPATIFLVSDLVGTRYSFWPNGLARILATNDPGALSKLPDWLRQLASAARQDSAVLSATQIDAVISTCKATRSDADMLAVVREFEESAAPSTEPERDLMSWAEIQEMKESGLIRFGSHTRRHTRLSGVAAAEVLNDEVIGSREVIERQLGVTPRTFCYPNGDTSPQAITAVRRGYHGAVTTVHGWNTPTSDPFVLNRIGVHEDVSSTRTSFLSRLAGVG